VQTYPKFVAVIALSAVIVLALASGASSNSARTTGATQAARHQADPINIAYLTKQLASVSFFTAQSKILSKLAPKYGAVVKTQDLGDQSNGDQAITILDTAIAGGADAIVITVPTTAIGPTVIRKAQAAKIPMVALFDQIKSASGKPLPFIGLSDKQFGQTAGKAAAKLYPKMKWPKSTLATTKIAVIEDNTVPACVDRQKGAVSAFLAGVKGFPRKNVIHVSFNNSLQGAITSMTTAKTAHPEVTNWVVFSCSDDGVAGGVRALQSSGVPAANILGWGQSAIHACEEFKKKASGYRGSTFIDQTTISKIVLSELRAAVKGKALPKNTSVPPALVTKANYKKYMGC
jgi:L-arabinose transport system substrate-binding protein